MVGGPLPLLSMAVGWGPLPLMAVGWGTLLLLPMATGWGALPQLPMAVASMTDRVLGKILCGIKNNPLRKLTYLVNSVI